MLSEAYHLPYHLNKMEEINEVNSLTFNCKDCGADCTYTPGSQNITCQYCGANNEIAETEEPVEEQDFHGSLSSAIKKEPLLDKFVDCNSCGASSSIDSQVTAANCPYCAAPFITDEAYETTGILPKSLIPFQIDKKKAQLNFKNWIQKSWFTPNDLKKASLHFDKFKGVYTPYWTYDTDYICNYTGSRGDHYYVTKTVKVGDKMTTRQVQETRWSPTSGSVYGFHNDLLVVGSNTLPSKYIHKLEPWDLSKLVPFDKNYLSGFTVERYKVELDEGFEIAKELGKPTIRNKINTDIGGDVQQIQTMNTDYSNITYKHLLLPLYVCAYQFKGEVYQFLVNAQTGEVQGERPKSWVKIVFAILFGLIIVGVLIWILQNQT